MINRGVIDRAALDRLCLSLSDLLEGLRTAGFLDPGEVGTAIVEANGGISAFADAGHRPPGTAELNVKTGYEGMPLMLIMDGRVQHANLERSGRDAAWLNHLLADRGLKPSQVYLGVLDTGGRLRLQLKRGGTLNLSALTPERVTW